MKDKLLSIISDYCVFLRRFVEENQGLKHLTDINQVLILLDNIYSDITVGIVPVTLYPKIEKLVNQIGINKLKERSLIWGVGNKDASYESEITNVITNGLFVKRTYYLFKAIDFVTSNVVLIGANGSGKTTFANSIRNELERTESGIVLPAQKILIFPTFDSLPTYKSALDIYDRRQKEILDDKRTFTASNADDFPYEMMKRYGSEMRILLSALVGERESKRSHYLSEVNDGDIVDTNKFRSELDAVLDIWNGLIEHRTLFCDDSCNLRIKSGTNEYPAYQMSDGEREIFYVVGRVLLAKPESLIIVDEPELHLHKAILNKLWDSLETKREDCMFIYLTHDIDFAATRNAKKCWLKSYTVDSSESWDVEPITDNEIPEPLLMKVLGSRKKVLFCEGVDNSLDVQVYEQLFSNYTIIPVSTCKDVINYTRAYNKIEGRYAEAYGIIDGDFRNNEQVEKLKTENVFTNGVAEVENLFLRESFIVGFSKYKNEQCDIHKIKQSIIQIFNRDICQQAASFVTNRIDYLFKESHPIKGKNKEEVFTSFSQFISQVDTDKWFEERKAELEAIVCQNNYEKAICVYNNKGLHSVVEKTLGISFYARKAIDFLRHSKEAKEILKQSFPPELL